MATYRLTKRPEPSIVTMTFGSYNEAIAFCKASSALNPSKPYKHGVDWKVAFIKPMLDKPAYERVEDWQKPFSKYDEWRSLEALYHIPVYVPQPKARHDGR